VLVLSLVLVATGLGLATSGIVAQRLQATAVPDATDVALGVAPSVAAPQAGVVYRALEPVLDLGASAIRRLSPVRRLDLTRRRIVLAGLEGTVTLERVLSYKAAATAIGLSLGLAAAPSPRLLWALVFAALASFVPDVLLSSRADRRQHEIGRDLPEALDLLALTVEAGLGFEAALDVVVDNTHGPLAGELARLLGEIELGVSRREALAALRERTEVPELSSFVGALVQSDQLGIALGDVLKTQAAQVRLRRRQLARERAAKTPVKILFPVVLGIFPALFVVTIGPGAIEIARTLF
jgi:tight adherence protein C